MQAAVDMVKTHLGPDAVILHTRKQPRKGIFSLLRRPRYEVLAAVESRRPRSAETLETPIFSNGATASQSYAFESEEARSVIGNEQPMTEALNRMIAHLRRQSVPDDLIQSLIAGVRAKAELPQDLETFAWIRSTMRELMLKYVPCVDTSQIGEDANIIVLVGPTGVGKTTTVAKLAANFALIAEKDVGIITADTYRIAAVDQLRTYANLIGAPLSVVYTPEEMKQAVDEHRNRDLIVIDTAGRSQYDKMQMNELRAFLSVLENPQIHLVVSATTKTEDLVDTVKRFQTTDFNRLIITKLDETRTFGPLLHLVRLCGKEISYITAGQSVPDDIEVAEASVIVDRLLEEDEA